MSIGKFHLVDVPQQIYDEPIFCDLQGTKFERKCKAINTLISIYKIIIYFQFWMKIQSKQTIKSHNFSHKNLVEHTHKSKFLMSGYCAFSKITAKDPLNASYSLHSRLGIAQQLVRWSDLSYLLQFPNFGKNFQAPETEETEFSALRCANMIIRCFKIVFYFADTLRRDIFTDGDPMLTEKMAFRNCSFNFSSTKKTVFTFCVRQISRSTVQLVRFCLLFFLNPR